MIQAHVHHHTHTLPHTYTTTHIHYHTRTPPHTYTTTHVHHVHTGTPARAHICSGCVPEYQVETDFSCSTYRQCTLCASCKLVKLQGSMNKIQLKGNYLFYWSSESHSELSPPSSYSNDFPLIRLAGVVLPFEAFHTNLHSVS